VVLCVKAQSLPEIVAPMAPLLDDSTAVVTAQNGIPFWYFHRSGDAWEGRGLESVDPGGRIWQALGPERAIGCVVFPSCEIVEPGVVEHVSGNRLMLGEPDGSKSERVIALAAALGRAGLKAPVRSRIRDDIWLKLWGNVAFNPVSVLTGATLEQMGADDAVRAVVRALMLEARGVAGQLGVRLVVDVDTRLQWSVDVGAHKTSMLQDLERGRPMEIDAIVGAVSELGRLVGVSTPLLDAVVALVRLRAALARSGDD
jgi:2-dehydropantoate 2-reductase